MNPCYADQSVLTLAAFLVALAFVAGAVASELSQK